jgi:hypothetical protein
MEHLFYYIMREYGASRTKTSLRREKPTDPGKGDRSKEARCICSAFQVRDGLRVGVQRVDGRGSRQRVICPSNVPNTRRPAGVMGRIRAR